MTARAQHATRASVQPNPARRFGGGAGVYPFPANRQGRSLAIISQHDTGI
ncbi:MAG TPA: hypothetical protein VGF32_02745 [Streptosporangiaceae bacterium]|jgi:hypothetical protein